MTDEGDTVFASFTDSDGKSVTLYGDEIKTPESVLTPVKGKAFAGWLSKDKKLLVAPGTTIKLDKNVEFDALYINFEQLYGAAVSYGDKTTLKFTAYVENDQLNSLKKLVGSVDLGMEIGKSGESTSSKKSTKTALGSSGKLYFYGVTDEINKEDFNKDFIAQAYIDITYSDGTTRRVYAQNDADANVRSVARIAKAALSDISDSEDSVYKYKTSEGKFSPYSEDERKHLLEKAES